MNQYFVLLFTTFPCLSGFPLTSAGQAHQHKIAVNFSAKLQTEYWFQGQPRQYGKEYFVSAFELYRDSIQILTHTLNGHCEFISDVLIIDDVEVASENYRTRTEEERAALDGLWLNVLTQPLRTGIFVKCWWSMGETVLQFPFPD